MPVTRGAARHGLSRYDNATSKNDDAILTFSKKYFNSSCDPVSAYYPARPSTIHTQRERWGVATDLCERASSVTCLVAPAAQSGAVGTSHSAPSSGESRAAQRSTDGVNNYLSRPVTELDLAHQKSCGCDVLGHNFFFLPNSKFI